MWKKYPEKMLRWHCIRQFAKKELIDLATLEEYDAEDRADHIYSELPDSFKNMPVKLINMNDSNG